MTELQDSEHFGATIEAIDKFDPNSINFIGEHPEAIRILHGHMEMGIFPTIMDEVQTRKLMGKLSGMSDIEAYYQVGEEMEKSGLLQPQNSSVRQSQQSNQQPQKLPSAVQRKRRSSGSGSKSSINTVEDLYSLSDDKFNEVFGDL